MLTSLRVVKDDTEHRSLTRTQPAHPVAELDGIYPSFSLYGTEVDREDDSIPLAKWHNLDARLHTRPLLGQYEFTAYEVPLRDRQEKGGLQWKQMLTVEVLM